VQRIGAAIDEGEKAGVEKAMLSMRRDR